MELFNENIQIKTETARHNLGVLESDIEKKVVEKMELSSQVSELNQSIDANRKEIKDLESLKVELQKEVEKLRQDKALLITQIGENEKTINSMYDDVKKRGEEMFKKEGDVLQRDEDLRKKEEEFTKKSSELNTLMNEHIAKKQKIINFISTL